MKNRKWLLIVSLVLALTMSLGGTLAYLTDTDEAVNVMTLGNVKVEQFEMERVFDENGAVAGMQEFTQGQPLYPVYSPLGNAAWQPNKDVDIWYDKYIEGAVGGNGTWQNMTGALDKFVFVKNTGDSDLYYRTWIAVEADTTNTLNEQGQNMIHLNVNGNELFKWTPPEKGDKSMGIVDIEGTKYNIYLATYTAKLTPGEISRPSLLQVGMDENATNEYVAQFGGTFEVLTFTQAVQTNNMPDAETALNAAFGPSTKEVDGATVINHPWKNADGSEYDNPELPSVGVSNVAELNKAIDDGKAATIYLLSGDYKLTKDLNPKTTLQIAADAKVTLDLNGKTITGTQHKNDGPVLKNEGTLTVVGGTIKSTAENGGSAIQNSGTITVNNVTLNGAPNANGSWPSYTVNNTGTMELNNSKITSYHGGVASYNEGAIVTLKDCELDMAGIPGFTSHGFYTYTNGKIVINGGTYANKAADQNSTGGSVINGAVEINSGTFSGRIENYYGTPVIKGGTFSVKPNPKFVAEGYTSVENGDGTWTVTAE